MSVAVQIAVEMFKIIVRDEIGTARMGAEEQTLDIAEENADIVANFLAEQFYNNYDDSVECTEDMARDFFHTTYPEV